MISLKGWFGEKLSQFGLWQFLDSTTYKRLHNLILTTNNGTTQIDHLYISHYGIFVVETKNYNGYIYGNKDAPSWTQVFSNQQKFKFQNPLRQNYKHTKAISDTLKINHDHVHSVILFIGEGKIKTEMPPNVVSSPYRAAEYIKKFNDPVFSDEQLRQFESMLYSLRSVQTSTREHSHNLKERYTQESTCPKCGKTMVQRTARRGSHKGNTFIACSGYPHCKYYIAGNIE